MDLNNLLKKVLAVHLHFVASSVLDVAIEWDISEICSDILNSKAFLASWLLLTASSIGLVPTS
jgi:hypothetical protein